MAIINLEWDWKAFDHRVSNFKNQICIHKLVKGIFLFSIDLIVPILMKNGHNTVKRGIFNTKKLNI